MAQGSTNLSLLKMEESRSVGWRERGGARKLTTKTYHVIILFLSKDERDGRSSNTSSNLFIHSSVKEQGR
jgi:hypothetical protein